MENKRKITAIILAVIVLLVMFYSAHFIAEESEHDCVGDDCPICCQINVCRSSLKNLSLAVVVAVLAAAFTFIIYRSIAVCTDTITYHTLISLKVKLTD